MSSCSSSSQESSTSPRMTTTTGEKNPVITKPKTMRKNSEKRKAKSRDAARARRSTESEIFSDIADLIPLPKDTVEQMDKISIMRLAVCYLKTMQTVASLNQDKLRRQQQLHHPQECHEQRKTSTIITASQSHFDKHSTNLSLPPASLGDSVSLLDGKFAMLSTTTFSHKHLPYTEFDNVLSLSSLNSFLLILTAKDGGIIFTSNDIEHVLGLKPIDVMGTSLYDYLHAYDHGEFEELLNQIIPTGGCFEDNNKHHQSQHQETCRNRVIRMKCVITERGKVVNIRQASFKPVRLIANHTLNGNVLILVEELADITHVDQPLRIRSQVTWEFTMDLKFSSVDMKRQESLFGYRQDELLGKSFYNYFHPLDTHHVSSALDCLYKKGQCETVPYRFLTKGGGHVWIVSQFSLLQDSLPSTYSSCSSSGTHVATSNLSSSCSPLIGNYHGNSGLVNTPAHCQHNLAGNCTSSSSHCSGGFIISIHHIVRYVCLCLPFLLDMPVCPFH